MSTTRLARQLRDYERQLEDSERHTRALRQIVEGLRTIGGMEQMTLPAEVSGDTKANGHSTNGHFPKGMDAIRAIVSQSPGVWSRKKLLEEFYKRGWQTTDDRIRFAATVDAALHRLRERGEAQRVRPGEYRFSVQQGKEAA